MDENTIQLSTQSNPQYHAERCPVCNGHGSVNWGKQTCNGCKGKGYLLIPNFVEDEKEKRRRAKNETLFK